MEDKFKRKMGHATERIVGRRELSMTDSQLASKLKLSALTGAPIPLDRI